VAGWAQGAPASAEDSAWARASAMARVPEESAELDLARVKAVRAAVPPEGWGPVQGLARAVVGAAAPPPARVPPSCPRWR
jgi:hypothetical protein